MKDDPPVGPGAILRWGELFLKGRNRGVFEAALERNVRRALAGREDLSLHREHGRILLAGAADEDLVERLRWVFGLSSYSPGVFCRRSPEDIRRTAVELAEQDAIGAGSFRISAKRADKSFEQTSAEIERAVGADVVAATGLAVDLERPQLEVGIEVGSRWTFVWTGREKGAGGLPVGTSGRALLLLSGGIDSPVAGHLLQKRGLELAAVYFHAFPYTGDGALHKARELARLLARRQRRLVLYAVPFAEMQEALRDGAEASYLVILYRRAMLRIAARLAARERIEALATGESLGQVASQTLANLAAVEEAAASTILRPLVGFDKAETIELARRIGSFDISVRPHDDCCTLFVPRHPETRGNFRRARALEERVEWRSLLDEAVENAEREVID